MNNIFPWIKAQEFISFPVFKTWYLNKRGFHLRPDDYFWHFSLAPMQCLFELVYQYGDY